MDYMDFLNKQAELAKLYQNGQTPDLSSLESNNTGEAGSLFGEQLSAVPKGDGSSVFNVASKEDLQTIKTTIDKVVSTGDFDLLNEVRGLIL